METLIQLLEVTAPVLVAAVAVAAMNALKAAVSLIDNAPALIKQLLVVTITFGLAKLSVLADVALPENLQGITLANLEALGAAAVAFAFHAGSKKAIP